MLANPTVKYRRLSNGFQILPLPPLSPLMQAAAVLFFWRCSYYSSCLRCQGDRCIARTTQPHGCLGAHVRWSRRPRHRLTRENDLPSCSMQGWWEIWQHCCINSVDLNSRSDQLPILPPLPFFTVSGKVLSNFLHATDVVSFLAVTP